MRAELEVCPVDSILDSNNVICAGSEWRTAAGEPARTW
jgi:hypothetical protein